MRSTVLAVATLSFLPAAVAAQSLPRLTPDEYDRWERLGAFELDPAGQWLAASIRRNDESGELRVHPADGSGEAVVLEHGTDPRFSPDGRWLAYAKGVHPDEAEDSEEPVRDRLGLLELATGRDSVLVPVRSYAWAERGGWIAVLGHAAADTVGADLLLLHPATGARMLLGNVDAFAWQPEGTLLAVTLRTAWGDTDGAALVDPGTSTVRTLDSRDARYTRPTWDEHGAKLAVLRSVERDDREGPGQDVLVWEGVDPAGPPRVLAAQGRNDLPDSLRVIEEAGISFEDGGSVVVLGVRPWDVAVPEAGGGEAGQTADDTSDGSSPDGDELPPADVQVWHWDDDEIIRAQEYFASRNARRAHLAAWHLGEDRLVVVGTELDEPVQVVEGGRWGVVADATPYRVERRFGSQRADWYRVDLETGERRLLVEGAASGVEVGVHGRKVLTYDGEDGWWAIDLATLERTAVDGGAARYGRTLTDYDFPGPRPPWGVGGWEPQDSAAYLYDRHDVWRVSLADGSAARITSGAEEDRVYRLVNLDPDAGFGEDAVIEPGERAWLSVLDRGTKASGYVPFRYAGETGPSGEGRIADVVLREEGLVADARARSLTRAAEADVYALRLERWDDSPDVFVGRGGLGSVRQVTRTNPFQPEYAWGRAELVRYTTDAGHDLQGVLVYPAGFTPGRRYPLIVYQYERLSDDLHRYDVPSRRDYYNFQTWSQQGYFVLMPDIVYEPGRPGPSAVDAVESALDAALATGHVDADRVGLVGHSWGGYQASYIPTRSDRFAASVAGAAITNFLSFMGAVHWNGGLPELGHWETGQARMAVPFWDDLEGHLESSPVHFLPDLETPVLLMHGDADGVVDFRQALEYYNYARRLEKPVVLLVYPGADHGLREESQQVDYHDRILAWFGHYLKGDPAPRWITEGETWVEREKRLGSAASHVWFR